jgi:hypothetical protein
VTDPQIPEEAEFGDDEDDGARCMTCGGDGIEECEDTDSAEGCWQSDCDGDFHTCTNCHGSGLAKDQWYW